MTRTVREILVTAVARVDAVYPGQWPDTSQRKRGGVGCKRMSGCVSEGERGRWILYRERMFGYVSEGERGALDVV